MTLFFPWKDAIRTGVFAMEQNYQDDAKLIFSEMYHEWRRPEYGVFLEKIRRLMEKHQIRTDREAVIGILRDIRGEIEGGTK